MHHRHVRIDALLRRTLPAAFGALMAAPGCNAFEIDVGDPDIGIRFDNTFKYSAAVRTTSPLARYTDPAAGGNTINSDDGDRSFRRGSLVSNRVDLLSEFDVAYRKTVGVRLSGAAWYDDVYNHGNDNTSPSTSNSLSVPYNRFPNDTRRLHGRQGEMLDAFAWGNFTLGDMRAQVKAGRHSLLWGETLFFAGNGIAGGQQPLDIVKLASVPSTPAKEFVLPVRQVSGQLQITPDWSVAGYYQYEWRRTRLPAAGSYFSTSDILDDGAESLIVGPGAYWRRSADVKPSNTGQYGVALKTRVDGSDIGLYVQQFHAKTPALYANIVPGAGAEQGQYALVFPQRIRAVGISANRTVGSFNIAGEASVRHNAPLTSNMAVSFMGAPAGDNRNSPLYAVGSTAHLNVNTLAFFGPNFLATSSALLAEVAWNRTLSCQRNCSTTLDPGASRDSWGFRATYSPTYYGVAEGVDLSPSLSASYFPQGKASAGVLGPHRGGDLTLGVDATYLAVWKAALAYTMFYGHADNFLNTANTNTFSQTLRDRSFISFTLSRTF